MIILVTPLLASQMEFGITSSSVRRLATTLATGKVDVGRTLATFTITLGLIGALSGAAVWILAAPISRWLGFATVLGDEQGRGLVRWCSVWVAVSLLTLMPGMLARSAQALVWITAVQTIGAALLWLGALALVRAGRPLSDVVVIGIALGLASALATTVAMRRHVEWSGPIRLDLTLVTADRRFSAGMFASQAAGAIVYQGDRILISAVGSPAMAGAYALCANVANKMLAAVVALTSFAFPHAASLHALGEHDRLQGLVDALDRGVAAIVMPVLLPGVLLAGPFLSLWLGDYGTTEVASVFRILWIAFAIPAFAVPVGSLLAAHGQAGLAARFAWLTAVVVVVAILLLVPRWGVLGAAVAMSIGMA
ncbi:MAG: lipopolysaccharide biosynthesis protein, partial [Burkholderiaceae bacterium]